VHELSLAESIVAIARDHARDRRVTAVDVTVGCLRQVVPDALEFAFELVAAGTVCEGAALRVEQIPVRLACRACGGESEADDFPLTCGKCGSADVDVIAGDELSVEAIELDDVPIRAGGR
jgi:hydrogenase nickel incorporation protein HypA/HybF